MKYTLDTIPVLDSYKADCECPLCKLRILCEDQYVDTMLASAYMEPEWRVKSNETGFCARHFELMFDRCRRSSRRWRRSLREAAPAKRACSPRCAARARRMKTACPQKSAPAWTAA